MPPGSWLLLATSTSITWTAPEDYHIRAVCGADSNNQWVLGYDGRTRVQLATTGRAELGTVIAWYQNSTVDMSSRNPMNVFLPKNTKLILNTTAAAVVVVLVFLTKE